MDEKPQDSPVTARRQTMSPATDNYTDSFVTPSETEMDQYIKVFDTKCLEELKAQMSREQHEHYHRTTRFGFLDMSPFLRNAAEAIAADSFTQCFISRPRDHWDFNFYLFPLYVCGVIVRYGLLLPLRIAIVLIGLLIFAMMSMVAALLQGEKRLWLQSKAITVVAESFLFSWCAVVREHGSLPTRKPGQIFVANHSSVLDVCLLLHKRTFSLTGQAHTGVIGFFQKHVLAPMGNLWFNRMESKDRQVVAQRIKEHAADITKPPLLVFPEGTCVNNEYVVMFKRGAFELGSSIVPVAIKYDKYFADAFWNSREQSFLRHLYNIMTSWALVVDVWIMEEQFKQPGESSVQFATRIKEMIAKQAQLKAVPWDGYLKYFKVKPEFKVARQAAYQQLLLERFMAEDGFPVGNIPPEEIAAARRERKRLQPKSPQSPMPIGRHASLSTTHPKPRRRTLSSTH